MNVHALLEQWPQQIPFFYFKHGQGVASIPTRFSLLDAESLREVFPHSKSPVLMGCLPYSISKAVVLAVTQELVWKSDHAELITHSTESSQFTVDLNQMNIQEFKPRKPNFKLTPFESDDVHLQKIEQVIRDIQKGRYYQLNLLRYFEAKGMNANELMHATIEHGGSQTGILRLGSLLVASLSPERFVRWNRSQENTLVETFPIKGTIPAQNPDTDLFVKKIRAELNIIVDLMRNDLHGICKPHSIKVLSSDSVLKTHYVKHLYAHLSGLLREDLSLYEIFEKLLPAGSITGAPKIEVMKAIQEYESHQRGYSMGNFFYFDPKRGYFDSSVSIRTFQMDLASNACTYAAGGGITIKSDPAAEIAEIWDKCRALPCTSV